MTAVTLGTWKVWNVMGNCRVSRMKKKNRKKNKTVKLVSWEIDRHSEDIVALSEAVLREGGQVTKTKGGGTFSRSGHSVDERR